MKRTVAVETEDIDSSTETESWIEHTPRRMSDHEIETSSSVFVTSEEVARQIKAVTDPLSQQVAHLCELLRELRNEQVNRRHEETASSGAASSSSGSVGRSDTAPSSRRSVFKTIYHLFCWYFSGEKSPWRLLFLLMYRQICYNTNSTFLFIIFKCQLFCCVPIIRTRFRTLIRYQLNISLYFFQMSILLLCSH